MDEGTISVSVGSLMALAGFLFQIGITGAAIAFSHGALNQRVRALEEKVKEGSNLSIVVARLETELEAVGREIKGLREDFRRVLDEFARVPRTPVR